MSCGTTARCSNRRCGIQPDWTNMKGHLPIHSHDSVMPASGQRPLQFTDVAKYAAGEKRGDFMWQLSSTTPPAHHRPSTSLSRRSSPAAHTPAPKRRPRPNTSLLQDLHTGRRRLLWRADLPRQTSAATRRGREPTAAVQRPASARRVVRPAVARPARRRWPVPAGSDHGGTSERRSSPLQPIVY